MAEIDRLETVPQHFLRQVESRGAGEIALRQKEFGIWREFSWRESCEQVRNFGLGLQDLGLARGDHVATIGDNDRQYLWAYLGLQAVGGVQVGLFTDATAEEAAYIIDHSDARFVLAQDQEQVDKMLGIREQIPKVERVIYWDERGLWEYEDPWLAACDEVCRRGEELAARKPSRFEEEVAQGRGDDLAILCYTSGTTGRPKGAMLSHENILRSNKAFTQVDALYDSDNHVSLLPLGWIAEHAWGVAPHCVHGMVMNFPENLETVRENVREIAPERVLYNSRLWDALLGTIQVRMAESSWINRKLYELFLPVGQRLADRKMAGAAVSPGLRLAYRIGDWCLFYPLRDKLGFTKLRAAYTAGGALSPDAMRFFHALGINLKQIYGLTEVTGSGTIHWDFDIKFASVGRPGGGVSVRTDEDGEIQIGGPTVFQGYYNNAEATAEAIVEEDGMRWFRTGDAGHIDEDGHLIYLDRLKDMITLASGERYAPQFIEGRLKFSPHILDVMAVGGPAQEYVTALVIINFDNVGSWAERQGISFTTFADLSQRAEVCELIRQAVDDVNAAMPQSSKVRRFVLLHKEFDADESEMTRSRKLRRDVLYTRYAEMIEAMYAGQEWIHVRTPVRYQDGSEGVLETDLKIVNSSGQ
ncbi:MAG: AMP-binding protein [Caldilineaceae bacterium]|nr:AMP-binding protein [Caldilineaceae bacterium]MDE0338608.1 AMP-binding protein [Caldilineaceae bacterium]